jgi:hypothetical protein
MNGRALIIVIAGAIIVAGTLYIWLARTSSGDARPGVNAYAVAQSRNISETAAAMALRHLKEAPAWRGDLFEIPPALFGGTVTVRADDAFAAGKHVVRCVAVGKVRNWTDSTVVYVEDDSLMRAPGR